MTRRQVLVMALAVEAGLGVLALLVAPWVGIDWRTWINWSWGTALFGVFVGIVLFGLLLLLRRSSWGPMRRLIGLVDDFVQPLFGQCRGVDLLLVAILAGIGEEFLFRGVIQVGLDSWMQGFMSPTAAMMAALVIASAVFGLLHFVSVEYFVFATILGLLMGAMVIWTGDLLSSVIAHAAYDYFALVYVVNVTRGRAVPVEEVLVED